MSDKKPGGSTPTFSRDIAPMFTQYDRIQMLYAFDLASYDDVKNYSDAIYNVVQPADPDQPRGASKFPGIPVMPLYEEVWSQEKIDTFKAWIDAGFPPGDLPPPPPQPSPELPIFLALSAALTGIEQVTQLDELGQIYLDRLIHSSQNADVLHDLLELWQHISDRDPEEQTEILQTEVFDVPGLAALAQEIILLWYNAQIGNDLGTPRDNQYTEALVWPVADCHPMGWATDNTPFYWRFQPENGQFTGLRKPTPPQSQQGSTAQTSDSEDD